MENINHNQSASKTEAKSVIWGKLPNKESMKSFPVISLLASNILIAVFAIAENQSVLEILWIYWFQSVIIGVFNFLKILSLKKFTVDNVKINGKRLENTRAAKISVGIFFIIHYGIFHIVYAGFLSSFSNMGKLFTTKIDYNFVLLISLVFFFNYLAEFIFSIRKEQEAIHSLTKVMMAPYKRIIPMHITIIISGFVMFGSSLLNIDGSNLILMVFMGLKTFSDLLTHQ